MTKKISSSFESVMAPTTSLCVAALKAAIIKSVC